MRIKTNYSQILLNTLISRKLKLLANRCRFALPIFEEKYKVIINTSDMLLLLWFVIRRCYFACYNIIALKTVYFLFFIRFFFLRLRNLCLFIIFLRLFRVLMNNNPSFQLLVYKLVMLRGLFHADSSQLEAIATISIVYDAKSRIGEVARDRFTANDESSSRNSGWWLLLMVVEMFRLVTAAVFRGSGSSDTTDFSKAGKAQGMLCRLRSKLMNLLAAEVAGRKILCRKENMAIEVSFLLLFQ